MASKETISSVSTRYNDDGIPYDDREKIGQGMDSTCSKCGMKVSASEYFCGHCGTPAFPVSADAAQPGVNGYAGFRDTRVGRPVIPSRKEPRIRWGWVIFGIMAAFLAVGVYYASLLFRAPTITASAPPGWSEAPEYLEGVTEEILEETDSGADLDLLFIRIDDTGVDRDMDSSETPDEIIYIAHVGFVPFQSLPETESVEEMEKYIRDYGDLIRSSFDENATVRELKAMPLSCGDVGMYVLLNAGGSMGNIEQLVIKKENTGYMVVVSQHGVSRFPSQEMQHLCETISFE
jgi:hypothetical protein